MIIPWKPFSFLLFLEFPNKDQNVIYEAGNTIGTYLRELGFNTDFAPDADVITNSENKVIGDRSFGTDAQEVVDMACAFSKVLHEFTCYECCL